MLKALKMWSLVLVFVFFLPAKDIKAEPVSSVLPSIQQATITLEIHNETIQEVLEQVAKETGFTMMYSEQLASKKISGKFQNVSLEEAIRRIFKGESYSLTVSPKEKIIIVKTYGVQKYKVAAGNNVDHLAKILGLTGSDRKKINNLHREQIQEIEKYLADPESVDPLTNGMTLGEIRFLHESQSLQLENDGKNPDISDEMSGTAQGKIWKLQKREYQELKEYTENQDSVDPQSGMKLGDIRALHKRQYKKLHSATADNSIDPFTKMTNEEIKALHKKQYRELMGK